ncbi:DinB family protein [Ectobacillus ponti]|uniref:DinB family protein n=1 Tax=Ectobacillus ponti TaxID=2961894 RepID=A0AA41X6F4_9BACI|nr:DinB family protein [Ectobacillus ponti]MCP8969662.1 DinB family protein [Ectobacillus ponti]
MRNLVEEYKKGYVSLVETVAGLSPEILSFKPSETAWSVHEILIHLADAESIGIQRMKKILAEDNPLLTAYDQDAFASILSYKDQDYKLALEIIKLLRKSFAFVLEALPAEAWDRTGVHVERGKVTLEELLGGYVDHLKGHIAQIHRNLDAYRALRLVQQ